VPQGPDLANWLEPHGREELGGRPFGDGTPPGPVADGEVVPVDSTPLLNPAG
jgi:glutathionyl-hydroquinone reductase